MVLIAIALALNIAVLIPVTSGLIGGTAQMDAAFGAATPARGILTSIYLTILALSVAGLFAIYLMGAEALPWIAPLLAVQIIYKLMTVVLVGLGNPVVAANLMIALFHAAALAYALTR